MPLQLGESGRVVAVSSSPRSNHRYVLDICPLPHFRLCSSSSHSRFTDTPQTGHPAISIPIGFLSPTDDPSARLPVGMQIVGKFYDEGMIYRAAYAWEQANDWSRVVVTRGSET